MVGVVVGEVGVPFQVEVVEDPYLVVVVGEADQTLVQVGLEKSPVLAEAEEEVVEEEVGGVVGGPGRHHLVKAEVEADLRWWELKVLDGCC